MPEITVHCPKVAEFFESARNCLLKEKAGKLIKPLRRSVGKSDDQWPVYGNLFPLRIYVRVPQLSDFFTADQTLRQALRRNDRTLKPLIGQAESKLLNKREARLSFRRIIFSYDADFLQ